MKKDGDHTYTVALVVRNRPGVLVRCAQIYNRRGHNIEALHVAPAKDTNYSVMTITAFGQKQTMDQIIAQLEKLIDVVSVTEQPDTIVTVRTSSVNQTTFTRIH